MTRPFLAQVVSLGAVLGTAFVAVPGCANDFDGLFASGGGGPSDEGGAIGSSGNSSSSSSSSSGGIPDGGSGQREGSPGPFKPMPASCGVATACVPKNTCVEDCTISCSGCDCACDDFDCREGDKCTTTCALRTTCATTCSTSTGCNLISKGATATLTCERTPKCDLSCEAGGTCSLVCGEAASCTMKCSADSSCIVRCGAAPCTVDCQGGERTDCPGGIVTCNQECPS